MVKIQPAALAALGIIWLIRDLYALESNTRLPRVDSDFYFNDVSTPASNPAPAEAPSNFPHRGVPLQPALPKEIQNNNQPTAHKDGNNVAKPMNDINPAASKTNNNEPNEKNVKKLLQSFVSLLLNLNDKEDGLMKQLKSYLGNEDDQKPKDVPSQVDTPSTMRRSEPKINLTTPATATPADTHEDDDSPYEDDGGIDCTSDIPQTTAKNMVSNNNSNVTPNPVQDHPDESARNPASNNSKPIFDIFQYQNEMGIISNNEFIDDIINSPKPTPENKAEHPNNSTEPSKTNQKPLNQSPSNENVSKQENENCTKSPISKERRDFAVPLTPKQNEAINSVNENFSRTPQSRIPSEGPRNLNPNPTQRSYQIPFTPETKQDLQNPDKEETAESSTAKPLNNKSQIRYLYPKDKLNVYLKPNAYNSRRIGYNKNPIYNSELIPKLLFRSSTQFPYRRIIPIPIRSYNHPNGFEAPRLKPQANQPQSDVPPENVPSIPNYPTDQNNATSNYDSRNPAKKNQYKMSPDDILSDFPIENDSNSPDEGLSFEKNPQPSKNMALTQVKESANDKNPCNISSIQNNPLDESVSKENENINPASTTEFALPFNPTEMPKQQYPSTAESSLSTEHNFYSTVPPVPQKEAKKSPFNSPRTKPFPPRNRVNTTTSPIKLNYTVPLNQNKLNISGELPSQNKLNNSDLSPESAGRTPQDLSSQSQQDNTDGKLPRNNSMEAKPTSETPLNNKPQNELTTSNPRNMSLASESQQTTDVPEVSTSTTLPDDSKEMHSEESDDYYPFSEEDGSGESEEEHGDAGDNEHDNENADAHDNEYDDTDDDIFRDYADEHNDYDEREENLLSILDNIKAFIHNATSEVPQNSSVSIGNYSTELPQNPIISSTDDVNKSTQNPTISSTNDFNKSPHSSPTPFTIYPAESPMDVDYGNQNTEPFDLKGPPYESILDYIYSHSRNPFFKELREEQSRIH